MFKKEPPKKPTERTSLLSGPHSIKKNIPAKDMKLAKEQMESQIEEAKKTVKGLQADLEIAKTVKIKFQLQEHSVGLHLSFIANSHVDPVWLKKYGLDNLIREHSSLNSTSSYYSSFEGYNKERAETSEKIMECENKYKTLVNKLPGDIQSKIQEAMDNQKYWEEELAKVLTVKKGKG